MTHIILHWLGRVAFVLCMLGLLAWAFLPLLEKRPLGRKHFTINASAVFSVVVLLLGLLGAGIAQFTLHFIQVPEFRFKVGAWLLADLWLSAMFAGFGLAQLKNRPWQTGRIRAFSSLIVFFLGFTTICVIAWFTVIAPPPKIQPFISKAYNFRFNIDAPWIRERARMAGSPALLFLKRPNPAMTFTIIAGEPGQNSTLTPHALAETAKTRLAKTIENAKSSDGTLLKIHDIDGLLVETTGRVHGIPASYLQWVTVTQGYSYELTVSAPASLIPARFKEEAIALFQNFELVRTNIPLVHKAKDYRSLTSGFSVKLAGTVWDVPAKNLYSHFPGAEFGIASLPNAMFAIIPIPLGGCEPDVTLFSHVLLWRLGVESIRECVSGLKEISHGAVSGIAFNFERSTVPGMLYRTEVLTGNGFGYFLIGYAEKIAGAERLLIDAFAHVEFDPAPAQPDISALTTRERSLFSTYCRELGNEYLKMNRIAEACNFLRRAQKIDPQAQAYARQAIDALIATSDYASALSYTNAAINSGIPENAEFLVRKAWLQQMTGDTAHALETYAKAFPYHMRDDITFSDYIQLLVREKKSDEALAAIAAYVSIGESKLARVHQASILTSRNQAQEALELLRGLDLKYPSDTKIKNITVRALLLSGRNDEALEECKKLLKSGRSNSLVHYMKGRAEYGLKRMADAKASLENALRQDPANPEIKSLLEKVTTDGISISALDKNGH